MSTTLGLSARHAWAAAVFTLLVRSVAAAEQTVAAPELKAAFVYNFAKFAEWPVDAGQAGPLTICVLGDAAVADALDATVKGRTIDERVVVILRVKAEELRTCHVLYVAGLDPKASRQIIDEVKSAPVLTVSDRDQFAQSGGIVGLFVEGGKMRFAINVEAVQRAGLRISSRLLSLATLVKDGHVHP